MVLDAVGNDAEHHHHSGERLDAPYRRGPSRTWLKNPFGEAVRREREEESN